VSGRSGLLALVERRGTVDTHGEVVVTFAGFVGSSVIVGGHVPVATQQVVNVVAVLSSVRANASTEAEFGVRNEGGPFVVLKVGAESVSVDQTTNGVAISICSVRIEFTSSVTLAHVDLGEITNASDLNVIRSLHKVDTLEGPIRDGTSAATGFGAPSNLFTFRVADRTNAGRSPETEVIDVVDPSSLALGTLAGSGATVVRSGLTILGLAGWAGNRIAHIPDLVRIATRALPNLKDIAISGGTAGKIRAFAMVSPGKAIVRGVIPSLILVFTRGITGINLEFSPICIDPVLYVETLGAKNLNLAVLEAPLLGGRTSARLNDNGSTVGIRRGGHAFSIVETGLDEHGRELSRGLSGGEGGERDSDCSDGGGDHVEG